jgi:hypothetical protein
VNTGQRLAGKLALDKLFCKRPATTTNISRLTLDQLVKVRILLRQPPKLALERAFCLRPFIEPP